MPGLAPGPLAGLVELPRRPGDMPPPTDGYWTGRELLFWGVVDPPGSAPVAIGAALDPATGTWRTIPDSPHPIVPSEGAGVAWTGEELIVCCGLPTTGAAAYDPDSDTWRRLPDAPVSGYATATWTGSELIVVTADGAASYNPDINTWQRLPFDEENTAVPPVQATLLAESVWTGSKLIVWPKPPSRTTLVASMYDPETRRWQRLPAPPNGAWPAVASIAWTGKELVVLGGLPAAGVAESERLVGARFDLDSMDWIPLPEPLPEPDSCECNLGSQRLLWTGDTLLVHVGALASGYDRVDGALLAYNPRDDSWELVGDDRGTVLTPVANVGDRVLLAGTDQGLYLSEPHWEPPGTAVPADGLRVVS